MLNKLKNIFQIKNKKQKRIYFDNASASDFSEITKKNIPKAFSFGEGLDEANFANSSSIHAEGEESKKVLAEARAKVAKFLKAKKEEIYFTASTTEANNIYIKGIIFPILFSNFKKAESLNCFLLEEKIPETAKEIYKTLQNNKPHIITSLAEHSSILEICKYLENLGAEVTYLIPNKIGKITTENILKNLKANTKLICLSLVNSETGTIQDVREIVQSVKSSPTLLFQGGSRTFPKVFVDATQAVKYLNLDVHNLGVDALTFGANKLGSIAGAAVLYMKQDVIDKVKIDNLISGGGQEEGIRSGTENLLAISLLAENLEFIKTEQEKNRNYVSELRNYFIKKVEENFTPHPTSPHTGEELIVEIFGDTKFKYNKFYENSAPHILLLSLSGMLGEELLLRLDAKGIAVSTATACSILEGAGSNFLKAIGEKEKAKETIRISFSEKNTKEEIDYFIKILKKIKEKYL
jgi:cysteine desulfurase